MSEIKSTLDLVMERTRHLSLSPEEKARQQRTDFEKRIQAALLQYADDFLTADALRERIAQLQTEFEIIDNGLVAGAVFKRIDPDQDNERWLKLIKGLAPAGFDPLRKILSDYREQRGSLGQAAEKRQLDRLVQDYEIEGSAVIPNPEKDAAYWEGRAALRQDVQAKIAALPHEGQKPKKAPARSNHKSKR